jgi:hypothetical protein
LIECFISAPGLVRSTKARIDFFVLLSFQEGSGRPSTEPEPDWKNECEQQQQQFAFAL